MSIHNAISYIIIPMSIHKGIHARLATPSPPRQTELAKVISECAGPEAAWRQLREHRAPREVGVRSGAGCRAFEERPWGVEPRVGGSTAGG